jgi:hypothetical protein
MEFAEFGVVTHMRERQLLLYYYDIKMRHES